MSDIVKTEAVVLKTMKYRETSKIVTLYTRRFGKVKAVAKGARRLTSKFGSSLEPMSYVHAILYKKEHRDLQLISECDVIRPLRRLNEELEKIGAGLSIMEIVDKVSYGEESNDKMFALIVDSLFAIDDAEHDPVNVLFGFQVLLAGVLGFRPEFGACAVCGAAQSPGAKEHAVFHVAKGGVLCQSHAGLEGLKIKISGDSLRVLQHLASCPMREAGNIDASDSSKKETESLLAGFLRYHVEALPGLRSTRVVSQFLSHAD